MMRSCILSSISRLWLLVAGVAVGLLLVGSISLAAPANTDPWGLPFPESDYILRRLGYVLENLRQTVRDDPKLAPVFDKIRLRAPKKSMIKDFPNAWAIPGMEGNFILVENPLVNQIAMVAEAAAYLSLAEMDGTNVNARASICDQLTNIARRAKETGVFPIFGVKLERFAEFRDPPTRRALQKMTGNIMDQTMVWILLHEVAHHVLAHRADLSNAKSRLQEQEADFWASETMHKLGFSLFGVERFLESRALFNECIAGLGYKVEEEDSTHPTWGERAASMRFQKDVNAAGFGYPKVFYIPAEPSDMFLYVAAPGNDAKTYVTQNYTTMRAASEWKGDAVTVYIRTSDGGRLEILVLDATRALTRISQDEFDKTNQRVDRPIRLFLAIQMELRVFEWMQIVPGIRYSDLRQPGKYGEYNLLVEQMRRAGAGETQIAAALQAKKEFENEEARVIVPYMKGMVQFSELPALIGPALDRANRSLEAALGQEIMSRLRKIQEEDPVMAWRPGQKADVYRNLEKKFLQNNISE